MIFADIERRQLGEGSLRFSGLQGCSGVTRKLTMMQTRCIGLASAAPQASRLEAQPTSQEPYPNIRLIKKSGPISGATLKRQGREGKSGKAMLTGSQSRAGMEMSR